MSATEESEVGSESDGPEQQLAGEASAEVAADGLLEPDEPSSTPPPPPDLTAAAFFDVDNTLVHGSSLVHFARGLAAREYFTYKDLARFALAQAKFQLTGRESSDDVAAGRRKALAFIEGRSKNKGGRRKRLGRGQRVGIEILGGDNDSFRHAVCFDIDSTNSQHPTGNITIDAASKYTHLGCFLFGFTACIRSSGSLIDGLIDGFSDSFLRGLI